MTSTELLALGESDFIQLTTFRKNGAPVPTPVWVVRDGSAISAFTPIGAGKLKRLRHTSRVTVQECSRRGSVEDGTRPIEATASSSTDPADVDRVTSLLAKKYGFQFKVVMLIEKISSRGRSRDRATITISD
ncbi:MAG: PPOX class F420-dependent oxidoreductase [Ornithinibacter sp.]